MRFKLKKPCPNCPFRAKGAIHLAKGRLAGIVADMENDHNVFACHTTLDGDEVEAEDGESSYQYTGNEQACVGALAYGFHHLGRLPVLARVALATRELKIANLEALRDVIKGPSDVD